MGTEKRLWRKRFIVLRSIPELLRPIEISFSQTKSPKYQNSGTGRKKIAKDIYVFQYTISGKGIFEYDGKKHEMTPGRAFFCNVTDEKMSYYYPAKAKKLWQFLYFTILDTTACSRSVSESCGHVFDIDPSETQIRHLLSYGDVVEFSIQIAAGAAHVFANNIIGMLVDQAQSETRNRGASLRIVKKALTEIEKNVDRSFNAAMLAKQIGVSQEHINRIFRDELGRTPYQCICEAKMQRATELLKHTDESISNVAAQLGYGIDSHFSRLFKRVLGVTPSQFRKGVSMPIHLDYFSSK